MMRMFLMALLLGAAPAHANPVAHMTMDTGTVDVELALDKAPVTVCNFIRYAQGGFYDGGVFFRTVLSDHGPRGIDVIQARVAAGRREDKFPPIALERTNKTGLSHGAGTISMARDGADTATSSFFVVIKDSRNLDFGGARNADGQGFAAFGHVVRGMDILEAIQKRPAEKEQITDPARILRLSLTGYDRAACESR